MPFPVKVILKPVSAIFMPVLSRYSEIGSSWNTESCLVKYLAYSAARCLVRILSSDRVARVKPLYADYATRAEGYVCLGPVIHLDYEHESVVNVVVGVDIRLDSKG
jgi:hypothetical protein